MSSQLSRGHSANPKVLAAVAAGEGAQRSRASFGEGFLAERSTIIDDIVAEIKARIAAGELTDGDLLPSQDDMARELRVSRASLREALHRLSSMGLVEMRHGKGTYVRRTRPQDLMNSLSSLLILDRPSAAELLEARLYVESALGALAALNATEADLERLRELMVRMERTKPPVTLEEFMALDAELHRAFAQAAKNPVLEKVRDIIWNVLPQRIRHIASAENIPTFLAFHREIYEAVARRDAERARDAMERHVQFLIRLNQMSAPGVAGER